MGVSGKDNIYGFGRLRLLLEPDAPEITGVSVSPATISPENADGNYDSTRITFKATHTEGGLTFKIIKDSTEIRNLTSNITWETDRYVVTWDGKNNEGVIVADGDYTCEIMATNSSGISTIDISGIVSVDNTPPPSPTDLEAVALSGGRIRLIWSASNPANDVAYYNIYRATTSGGENFSSPTYTVPAGTITYMDEDKATANGQTYYYVVRAEDAVGNIETNTEEISATASGGEGPTFASTTADKSSYKNGETITLTVQLADQDSGCTLSADFSNIDDHFEMGMENFVDWASDGQDNDGDGHIDEEDEKGYYSVIYTISSINGKSDGNYSVSVTATDSAANSTIYFIYLTLDNSGLLPSLQNLKVYPNPFNPTAGHTQIIFDGLTSNARIQIFTLSGELIADSNTLKSQEKWIWNVTNKEGKDIVRGIYIYLVTNSAGEKKTGKVAVIK